MILQELQDELLRCDSLSSCDEFLRDNLHEIRPLFYGLTRTELQACRIDYEDALLSFSNSPTGREIQQGAQPPQSVVALLIFFLSLFERAGLYNRILSVANLLPPGSLRHRAEAIFEYKNITDSQIDYIARFERIVSLINEAWHASPMTNRHRCEDLLREYALDAILLPVAAGINIREEIQALFRDSDIHARYQFLSEPAIQNVFDISEEELPRERIAVRSRIVESLHSEACDLVPEALITAVADEFRGEEGPVTQTYNRLPEFLDEKLEQMGATYSPLRRGACLNFDADTGRNLIYLGTYFPKTVVESWNIVSELLSIPFIDSAFAQKDVLRILDIGSGTGAAVVGTLLALSGWDRCEVPIEIVSMDINLDALSKQEKILESLRQEITLDFMVDLRHVSLPFDLDGFVDAFSDIADQEGHKYDLIIFWKCLCEFYNYNFAQSQGVIQQALQIASRMVVSYGLCIISDVTTTDNDYEYFAYTLNREINRHDASSDTDMRTILPLPCARNSATCQDGRCYTQRKFFLQHRRKSNDETKIAYRVLAPNTMAESITATFSSHPAYRVNAARPAQACFGGRKSEEAHGYPCGYTSFYR